MYVCHCMAVSDRTVRAAVSSGASTVEDITDMCHAGGGCGGCHSILQSMLDAVDADTELVGNSAA
jgi:bacterioferritin-associated ferredoxin